MMLAGKNVLKRNLIFVSAILGWFAVLLFMIGYNKEIQTYIRAGFWCAGGVVACMMGVAIINYIKNKKEQS